MREGTTIEQFTNINPDQFTTEIDRVWEAAGRVKDAVAREVQEGNLPVLTGLAITACLAGQALGYAQFHGEASPADLLTALDVQRQDEQARMSRA